MQYKICLLIFLNVQFRLILQDLVELSRANTRKEILLIMQHNYISRVTINPAFNSTKPFEKTAVNPDMIKS